MESERILSSLGPQCPPPMANHAVVRSSHDHHAADFFSWITRGLGSPGSDRRRNPTRQNVLHPASDAASTKSFAAAAPDAAEEATSRQCRDDAPRLLTKSNLNCAEYEDARAKPVTQRADATATGAIQSQEHQERLRAELEQTKANNLKLKAQIWELRARESSPRLRPRSSSGKPGSSVWTEVGSAYADMSNLLLDPQKPSAINIWQVKRETAATQTL
jgi:hypothetical protein